jgi:hypothetical protein
MLRRNFKKCCLMLLVFAITLVSALPVMQVFAADTITVDCASTLRGVTHAASGSLYGVTETKPADVAGLITPTHPFREIRAL